MQYGHWHNIFVTGIMTLVLTGSHYLFPLVGRVAALKQQRITSFASGLVVAYIFLHMLPSLVESRDHIYKLLANTTLMTQSKDLIIFVAALVGFEVFYFFERCSIGGNVSDSVIKKRNFRIHLSLYFVYNFLITYSLLLSIEANFFYTVLYVLVVSIHFILTDNHFNRHFKEYFNYKAHLILAAGLILGFITSIGLYPVQLYIAAVMTALLSGAILYNAFTEEITLTRETSIFWFFIGSLIIGVLLGLHLAH